MKTLEVIDLMFDAYIRSDDFVNLSSDTRNEFCDRVEELKELAITADKNN
jgi:hypothetical protein